MTFEELDSALEELESRLERLRALYEQYFLGFEKMEPAVPRKDVDRRIYVLRREKIRNTGRRFKLQTLIQRYNTFQQYWQRVCREIENGTYRRHILRAERQMNPDKQLTIATKRRFGRVLALQQQAAAEANGAPAPSPAALEPRSAPPSAPPSHRPAPLSGPPRPGSAQPARPTAHARAEDRSFESLELDMGFLGSWVPPAQEPAPKVPNPASSPKAPPPKPAPRLAPPPKPTSAARAAPPAKPKSSPHAAPPPRPASSMPAAPPPRPATSASANPALPPPQAAPPPKPAFSSQAAPPPRPEAPAPKPRSSPRAAPPPKPAAARPPPKPAAPPPEARAIADDRVRELHQKLMDMKRQNKEAGQVSLEGLAKTLRETESKLRSQHKNRKIDFDVVIRDGKAIVKPTVR